MSKVASSEHLDIRRLEGELRGLVAQRDKCSTYHANILVQNRRNERNALINEQRSQIRLVVDNSEFFE